MWNVKWKAINWRAAADLSFKLTWILHLPFIYILHFTFPSHFRNSSGRCHFTFSFPPGTIFAYHFTWWNSTSAAQAFITTIGSRIFTRKICQKVSGLLITASTSERLNWMWHFTGFQRSPRLRIGTRRHQRIFCLLWKPHGLSLTSSSLTIQRKWCRGIMKRCSKVWKKN